MDTKDCPFCLANGLLRSDIIAQNDEAFLIRNTGSPKSYLIIPTRHYESLLDLPDTWWQSMRYLLNKVPGLTASDYNVSVNVGWAAGQTVKHLHFWIIPREKDVPAAGKGLAKLLDEANIE